MRTPFRVTIVSLIALLAAMVTSAPVIHQSAAMSTQDDINALRSKVKYVFVLYQENRSFDSYFGTFPGADGIYSQPPAQTAGYNQPITNTDGTVSYIHPFLIGPAQYASDTDDIDHSHSRIVAKMHVVDNVPQMDRFAMTEEVKYSPTGTPSLTAKQFGELAMAYEDCNTIPFLWQYAKKFTLFDHVFQTMTGPSTPGNLAIIGAQTGVTQWMLHPQQANATNGDAGTGVPVLNDADPFWGSQLDPYSVTNKMPVNPGDFKNGKEYATQVNLTYATLPLTFAGKNINKIVSTDRHPATDLVDVHHDIAALSTSSMTQVSWGWYEEGFNKEPTDNTAGPTDANGTHASYIAHHNGPQYFGYVANNPQMSQNLHGLNDLYSAIDNRTLANGGVFYVKGGYQNTMGLKPADPNAKVQANFTGDDDHPGYSDSQISEAMLANTINKIAQSPYWSQSAIIVTWDDSEGDYDHVQPPLRTYGPDGALITQGPRVPLLVISPYARTGYIAHEMGDQASVVKFVDMLFNRTPLALLPDELHARQLGESMGMSNMGPIDALTTGVSDLTTAFDPNRLNGTTAPLSASYVTISNNLVMHLPQQTGYGCAQVGIVPTDQAMGLKSEIPADFNPRPKTNPTVVMTSTVTQ